MIPSIDHDICSIFPSFEERVDFMTIGNFLHNPNWDAVGYLKKDIWPRIRKVLPKAKLHVYGAYGGSKAKQLHKTSEGFLIEGKADSAGEVFKAARICLAPLRFGAGLKGKIVDGMQYGTPNITSTIGAEGMISAKLAWNGAITDDIDVFVKEAVHFYTNKKAWEKAQINGINLFNSLFNVDSHSSHLKEKILRLYSDIECHRAENFIGKMLNYHGLKSTEYFSKWIAAKNA